MIKNFAPIALVILIGLLPVHSHAQTAIDGDYPIYDGLWETDLGVLAMWQENDAVWGIYLSSSVLGGRIDDDGILHFRYEENPDDRGSGWFKVSEDGSAFEGYYTSEIEPSIHDNWIGTWLGPNFYEVDDREALNYQPGEIPPDPDEDEDIDDDNVDLLSGDSDDSDTDDDTPEPPSEFTGDPESAWNGAWETNLGEMELIIDAGNVTGTWGEGGSFEGTISGSTLNGTWLIVDEDGNETGGEVLFSLSEDGVGFRGTYNTSDEPNLWLAWHGTKL